MYSRVKTNGNGVHLSNNSYITFLRFPYNKRLQSDVLMMNGPLLATYVLLQFLQNVGTVNL